MENVCVHSVQFLGAAAYTFSYVCSWCWKDSARVRNQASRLQQSVITLYLIFRRSYIIDTLHNTYHSTPVLFFYCSYKEEERRTAHSMSRTLLKQLFSREK